MDIEKLKQGQKSAIVSIVVSLILAIVKATVGLISGAIILVTDALDSATDIFSSLAAFFGLKLSEKEPNKRFNYGYYKSENLASLFISGLIIWGAVTFFIKGFNRLFTEPSLEYPWLTFTTIAISGIVALIVSFYLKKKGEEINSQSLIANSRDRLKDFFVSIMILITVILTFYKIPYIQGSITMLISLAILRFGFLTAKDSIFSLMDVSPKPELEKKVEEILKSIKGVEDFSKLKLRKAGPFVFGDVDITVKKFIDVSRAHELSDKIQKKIGKKIPEIEAFSIHIEPYRSNKNLIVIPTKNKDGLASEVINHFGRADYFLFADIKDRKLKNYKFYKNQFKKKEVRAGLDAAHFIEKRKADMLVTDQIGEIAFHTLRDHYIDIFKVKGKTAKQVIDNFCENKLERLKKPTKDKD
jgi:cation diffusion facilitator family transporter